MRTSIILILGLLNLIVRGQLQTQLPNFSLDGITSTTISVSDLETHLKIVPKDASQKIVSFEFTIKVPDQGIRIFPLKSTSIPPHAISYFKRLKDNQSGKLWIDNVKALKTGGDTVYYRTPLIMTVKK